LTRRPEEGEPVLRPEESSISYDANSDGVNDRAALATWNYNPTTGGTLGVSSMYGAGKTYAIPPRPVSPS
jgi:hypothetical protein